MYSCFLLILSIVPKLDGPVCESADLVEVNWFYDEHARLVFQQLIFYDWRDNLTIPEYASDSWGPTPHPAFQGSRFQVFAWRLVKTPDCLPQRDHATGEYVCFWQDGEVLRKVRSKSFRESWTQYDVELEERAYLPKEKRRELRPVRIGKRKGA